MSRVLRGFALLGGASIFTQLVGFAAYVVAARALGPADFGAASIALSLAIYVAIPANFGLTITASRDLAREPARRREVLSEILVLRTGLGIACGAALALAAPLLAANDDTRRLLPLAALSVVATSLSGEWALLGLERRGAVALTRFVGQAAYGVLVLAAISSGFPGAREYVLFTVLSMLLTSVLSQVLAIRSIGRPTAMPAKTVMRRRITSSAPLGLVLVMVQVYLTLGLIVVGYVKGAADAGQFAVAQKIPLALYGINDLWNATLFPLAARLMATDREGLRRQVGVFVSLGVGVSLPLVVGGALLADDLVPRLFGREFSPAAPSFAVMLVGIALAFVTVNFVSVLVAADDERQYAIAMTLGAVATLVLDLVLVPTVGIVGAAIAIVCAELAILTYVLRRYRAVVGAVPVERRRMTRIVGATAVMGATLAALHGTDVLLRLGVGAAVYVLAALALGVIGRGALRSSPIG